MIANALSPGALLLLALAIAPVQAGLLFAGTSAPAPARQAELLHLVRQDCGSCHGLRMEGGLGLPLSPLALKDQPPEALVQTILHGRRGTAMPSWRPFLSDGEAGWIVEVLLKGLPDAP